MEKGESVGEAVRGGVIVGGVYFFWKRSCRKELGKENEIVFPELIYILFSCVRTCCWRGQKCAAIGGACDTSWSFEHYLDLADAGTPDLVGAAGETLVEVPHSYFAAAGNREEVVAVAENTFAAAAAAAVVDAFAAAVAAAAGAAQEILFAGPAGSGSQPKGFGGAQCSGPGLWLPRFGTRVEVVHILVQGAPRMIREPLQGSAAHRWDRRQWASAT